MNCHPNYIEKFHFGKKKKRRKKREKSASNFALIANLDITTNIYIYFGALMLLGYTPVNGDIKLRNAQEPTAQRPH